jgi:lipoprotein-anchoring transpeptidase ErfK/SrfK
MRFLIVAASLMILMHFCPAYAQDEKRELGAFALGEGALNPENSATDSAAPADELNEEGNAESGIESTPQPNEKVDAESDSQPDGDQSDSGPTSVSPTPVQGGSQILINIDKSRQEMTVFIDGIEQHTWPVSTGAPGYATPSGNFTASSMNEVWYSKEWDNAPMPNSIFFTKEGHAIHGSYETKKLGRAVSHGCVRLAPENAKALYALVKEHGLENTKVVLSGVTPGGEAKVAKQGPTKKRSRQTETARYDRPQYYYPSGPQRRGVFARRWSGGPYFNGPQGYDSPPRGYYPPRGYRRYAE